MALHPQCKSFLDLLAAAGGRPLQNLTPQEARQMVLPADLGGPEAPMHRVDDRRLPGPGGPIPVRVYTPVDEPRLPALVFFHGGGFVLGGLDMPDRQCRQLAALARCVVVSVDYRLAPEHRFPAAAEDAYAATRYVAEHAGEFGADASRIAVGGESAGGNLAAVTAVLARDRGAPSLAFQLLVYPLVDFGDERPSMLEYADGHFLTRASLDYFRDHYLGPDRDRLDPRASPLRTGDVSGLPPAFILTAECDPLRDQGEAYASRLERAGVAVEHRRYEGMIHPFFSLGGIVDAGMTALSDAASAVKAAFARRGALA